MVDVALALQEQGHQVKIITSHFDPKHAFEPTYDGTLKVELARTLVPPHACAYGLEARKSTWSARSG